MSKVLIAYGTRYGAAASTSEEIATVLRQEGVDVKVVNTKEDRIRDITDYTLVIVGSGIQINKWTREPEDFLKKHQKELAAKKRALFVCCGSASPALSKDKTSPQDMKTRYLDEKAAQYGLHPAALGFFGGIYNYNKVPWWAKSALNAERLKIAAAYKETQPNVYDTRDLNAINSWVKELAQSAVMS